MKLLACNRLIKEYRVMVFMACQLNCKTPGATPLHPWEWHPLARLFTHDDPRGATQFRVVLEVALHVTSPQHTKHTGCSFCLLYGINCRHRLATVWSLSQVQSELCQVFHWYSQNYVESFTSTSELCGVFHWYSQNCVGSRTSWQSCCSVQLT